MARKLEKQKEWMEKSLAFKGFLKYTYDTNLNMSIIKPLTHIPYTITINKKERFVLLEPCETLFGKPLYWVMAGYPLTLRRRVYQTTNPILIDDKVVYKRDEIEVIPLENQKELLRKYIAKDKDNLNIDIIEPEVIIKLKKEFELKGKKAFDSKSNQYTSQFQKFLKENLKDSDLDFGYNDLKEQIVLEKVEIPLFHTSQDFQTFTQSGYCNTILNKKFLSVNQILIFILTIICTILITYTLTSWILGGG